MPLIHVVLYDHRIDKESSERIIRAMTDAMVSVIGENIREQTQVLVQGLPPAQWGVGGKPSS